MKKILSLFAAIGLLLLVFSPSVCYAGAEEEENAQIKADVQASVTEFVEAFPARTPGSEAEKKSAEYLAGKLFGYGLADYHSKTAVSAQSYLQSFSFYVNGEYYDFFPEERVVGKILLLVEEFHRYHENVWKNFPWNDYMYELDK